MCRHNNKTVGVDGWCRSVDRELHTQVAFQKDLDGWSKCRSHACNVIRVNCYIVQKHVCTHPAGKRQRGTDETCVTNLRKTMTISSSGVRAPRHCLSGRQKSRLQLQETDRLNGQPVVPRASTVFKTQNRVSKCLYCRSPNDVGCYTIL